MKRKRSSQKKKILKAISQFQKERFELQHEFKQLKAYVECIRISQWFQKNFPHIEKIRVKDGRGGSYARWWSNFKNTIEISFPRDTRKTSEALFLICAGLNPPPNPRYGPQFCSLYLKFVKRWMGQEPYELLKEGFYRHGIKFRTRVVKEKTWIDELKSL